MSDAQSVLSVPEDSKLLKRPPAFCALRPFLTATLKNSVLMTRRRKSKNSTSPPSPRKPVHRSGSALVRCIPRYDRSESCDIFLRVPELGDGEWPMCPRHQQECHDRERLDRERLDRERIETKRLEKERVERECMERERAWRESMTWERERLWREYLERGRIWREYMERGWMQRELIRREHVEGNYYGAEPDSRVPCTALNEDDTTCTDQASNYDEWPRCYKHQVKYRLSYLSYKDPRVISQQLEKHLPVVLSQWVLKAAELHQLAAAEDVLSLYLDALRCEHGNRLQHQRIFFRSTINLGHQRRLVWIERRIRDTLESLNLVAEKCRVLYATGPPSLASPSQDSGDSDSLPSLSDDSDSEPDSPLSSPFPSPRHAASVFEHAASRSPTPFPSEVPLLDLHDPSPCSSIIQPIASQSQAAKVHTQQHDLTD